MTMNKLKLILSAVLFTITGVITAQDNQSTSTSAPLSVEDQAMRNGYSIARNCGIKDKQLVSDILGLSIDYYISRDMPMNRESEMQTTLRESFERDMLKLLSGEQKEKFKAWMAREESAAERK
jgi:hypothetical protein